MFDALRIELQKRGVAEGLIEKAISAGYFLKGWLGSDGKPYFTVSDSLYGNKALSSSFGVDQFAQYLVGESVFDQLPPLNRIRVKNRMELDEYLNCERIKRYVNDGSLTMRGQSSEYMLRRAIPNPVRADALGNEISIIPGSYRQPRDKYYSLEVPIPSDFSIREYCRYFDEENDGYAIYHGFDHMRVEQHYARQTSGLDITFDIDVAIFFATNKSFELPSGSFGYEPVPRGEHAGVIYLFRFGSPSVRRSEFLIERFDFYKRHYPLRILRQICGLPLFGQYERNIAVTDVDTVIELDPDFEMSSVLAPEFMFPSAVEDSFYGQLLSLKDRFPERLADVVEYSWAR
ncbi:hypothetical protein [Maricaulis salignorans]|uniref:FRG domain-containing protein n=1 Tax=Maricaulis salignorans TaxID=144026 RepID=A0A1G9RZM3_9PROT|nr:hypothetical protein [Maricaulis salignorans]SDM28691.1 hypothetical protein SAMN04488568_10858 [Maricaulis salignorans]